MIQPQEAFIIERNKIRAKYPCSVAIDEKDYDKRTWVETSSKFQIPGMFEFYIPQFNDYSQIILNYAVDLIKTENIEIKKTVKVIHYTENEVVMTKDYVPDETDIGLLEKILQGHIKYVSDPKIIINMLHDILPSIDLVHFELVVSNMFRVKGEDNTRCRFKGDYKNSTILGIKQQPFQDSWKSALAFQYIEKAIQVGLVKGKPTEMNPIEKVLNEEFDDL